MTEALCGPCHEARFRSLTLAPTFQTLVVETMLSAGIGERLALSMWEPHGAAS